MILATRPWTRSAYRENRTTQEWNLCKVVYFFAIQENEQREKNKKSAHTKHPLFIYNLSVTHESFPTFWITSQLLSYNLPHRQEQPDEYQYTTSSAMATPSVTCLSYWFIQPLLRAILMPLLCSLISSSINETIPSGNTHEHTLWNTQPLLVTWAMAISGTPPFAACVYH